MWSAIQQLKRTERGRLKVKEIRKKLCGFWADIEFVKKWFRENILSNNLKWLYLLISGGFISNERKSEWAKKLLNQQWKINISTDRKIKRMKIFSFS